MKKVLLASVALIGVTATSFAADLPRRMAAPAPLPMVAAAYPAFTWTGFYAGVHAGYGWGDTDVRAGDAGGFGATGLGAGAFPATRGYDSDGGVLGVQAGYNAQFGSIVAGVEGDIAWSGIDGSDSSTVAGGGGTLTTRFRTELDWLGTLRARVGVAFDRALIYGTGGFAFGDVNQRGTAVGSGVIAGTTFEGSSSEVSTGYSVGAGVEYALTNNMTVRGEWLYYDLGRETVRVRGTGGGVGGGDFVDYRIQTDGNIARVGLNMKF